MLFFQYLGVLIAAASSVHCSSCVSNPSIVSGYPCQGCTPGTYSNYGLTDCTYCAPGFAIGACNSCGPYTYSDVDFATVCTGCPTGYTSGKQASACNNCPNLGLISDGLILKPVCVDCGVGQYILSGTLNCGKCSAGTYSASSGVTACTNCAPGLMTPGTGYSACSACDAAQLPSNATFVTLCTWLCNTGFYNAIGTSCTACTSGPVCNFGFYSPTCTGGKLDTQFCSGRCVPGNEQFANVIWLSGSKNTPDGCSWGCPQGRYKDSATQTCRCCAVNYLETNQTKIDQQCVNYLKNISCPVGKYPQGSCFGMWSVSSYSSAPVCAPCSTSNAIFTSSGVINSDSSCSFTCNYGFFANNTQCQPWQTKCPLGYSLNAGTATADATCTVCVQPHAVFNVLNSCTFVCVLGYELVSGSCQGCSIGKYRNSLVQIACVQCPSGTYTMSPQSVDCNPAPVNGWSSLSGGNFTCNAGFVWSLDIQGASCSICNAGYYAADVCTVCPLGTYNNQSSAISVCRACAAGTFAAGVSSTACDACAVGFYSVGPDPKPSCSPCFPGTFSAASMASFCSTCATGTYAPLYGLSVCSKWTSSCPSGYSWSAGTATQDATCQVCAYPATNLFVYVPNTCSYSCVNGYQAGSGCQPCAPGTFKAGTNSNCTSCSPGTYQSGIAMSSCVACLAGTFSTGSGNSSGCTKCRRGMYAAVPAATQCLACSIGTYSTAWGSNTCLTCASGFTCGRGATYCYAIGSKTAFYNTQAAPACQAISDLEFAVCGM